MRKEFIFTILSVLAMVSTCFNMKGQENNDLTVDQIMYELKAPVKKIIAWESSVEEVVANPQINFSDYRAVKKAIDNYELNEMTNSVSEIEISSNKKAIPYDNSDTVIGFRMGLPGLFKIKMVSGRPVTFILDEKDLNSKIENGEMFIDGYDMCLENFTITYDMNGFAKELKGKATPFFGDGIYTETYSNYKFDSHGNWVRRQVSTPYSDIIQYRSYEY
ncbi:MAG: hypothetical protein HDS23_07025 [Bacteroides sp.]|nr:hypothetical protein [Bacteroides sp.]